jgi:N-carbamoyl-L-amino-acid hydrolase
MNRREFGLGLLGALGAARFASPQSPSLRVNPKRLSDHLKGLAEFGKNPEGGVSRVAYSESDRLGRRYVIELMRAAALEPRIDAAGNITGRRPGSDSTLAPIVMGSHIDSVPKGGNYDGTVGSLSAIEAAQILHENRIETRHPIEVLIFQNEEGGQFGSRILIGAVEDRDLDHVSHSGKTVREGIRFIGGDPENLDSVRRRTGYIAAYLEIHIEQGAILDTEKIDIGIVEGIVGINRHEVTIEGIANHAGTTPMHMRHDALLAGAKLIEAVHRIVTGVPGRQVGTVGRIEAQPGAPNVIPGTAILTIELRDLDWDKIRDLYQRITAEAQRIGSTSGTHFSFREFYANHPSPSDPKVRGLMVDAAKELGLSYKLMPSGAGHDAQGMARIGPMGMIFIPSVGGISHSPQEFSRTQDIANGANVLLHTILKLDQEIE